jgi:hypothetical protein
MTRTYRATVRMYRNGKYAMPGDVVAYDGEPDWMFEPIDKAEHRLWLATVADPRRVAEEQWRAGNQGGRPGADQYPDVAEKTLLAKWQAYSREVL